MKLGVYGGTFNPVHLGHLHILREFIRRLSLDRVLMIPTGVPPHKQAPDLAPGEDRVQMCRLAAREIREAEIIVSEAEISRTGKSFTADTLMEIHREHREDQLFFLMGEDMFLTLHKWYHPEEICRLAVLCASPRSTDGMEKMGLQAAALEKSFGARCRLEDIPYLPDSSTQVRALAREGKDISSLVPEAVARYIEEHQIYRKCDSV